ncbi:MAG: Ig-like domain-containing protein [Clostridia bacterium]|nr:Ig-like domain-containing protein [Clostridia bacterium]
MKRAFIKMISLVLSVIIFADAGITAFAVENKFRIIVPEDWEMSVGQSRSVDTASPSGVYDRSMKWSSSDEAVARVDKWGRVTAVGEGSAEISVKTGRGERDTVKLTIKNEPTLMTDAENIKVDYQGGAVPENDVLQKVIDRFSINDKAVPGELKNSANYPSMQRAVTADGSIWEITDYGVLRTDRSAKDKRDVEQRFMGNRYFASADTGGGNVLAIAADGENGIWTVTKDGVTHIRMLSIDGTRKAAIMSDDSQRDVERNGFVSNSVDYNYPCQRFENDNDGLWTSMYGAGELMRYAVLRDDPDATADEVARAREIAVRSTEAVLLLTYISMREGTVESYVRAQRNGRVTDVDVGKYYGREALELGADGSQNMPFKSPAAMFTRMQRRYKLALFPPEYFMSSSNLSVISAQSWSIPEDNPDKQYEKQTRTLEGFWARSFVIREKKKDYINNESNISWSINGDGTAVGFSDMPEYTDGEPSDGYYINGENMRGKVISASKAVPERLWNDIIRTEYEPKDIEYRGDTSADEIIGHLFIYKLAYDILGEEDPELKALICDTMDSFARHLTANGYNLVEGAGQPTTWGKFSREYFHNGSFIGGAPLHASVLLAAFKVAAYVTHYKKWEDEYRMAALDPQYEYAELSTQTSEQYDMAACEYASEVSPVLGHIVPLITGTKLYKTVNRMIIGYSDMEMAMLAAYVLMQTETDGKLLSLYRGALDDWWVAASYLENPLWNYIYQLAYPSRKIRDSYKNDIVSTSAWSLSRHPIETVAYLSSNPNRDDVGTFRLSDYGIKAYSVPLTYDRSKGDPLFNNSEKDALRYVGAILAPYTLKWKVAAPDERSLTKYNSSTYYLNRDSRWNHEGSTTYTLPYWMGRYHGMIK